MRDPQEYIDEIPEEFFEDVHFCPQCDGIAFELGTLGNITHFRCRNCHWDFTEKK